MKVRSVYLFFLFMVPLLSTAQVQHGHVKTSGRPGKPGTPLSGVTIRVKNIHNAILSGNDGKFSFTIPGIKDGKGFVLSSVSKTGYRMKDESRIGTMLPFSQKIPLQIVMISQMERDEIRNKIEEDSYKKAERAFAQKKAELDKMLAAQTINVKKYQEAFETLNIDYERYVGLIGKMADYCAEIDYDELNEKDREIALLIETGELEKADSILHTVIDVSTVVETNRAAKEELKTRREAEQKLKRENDKAEEYLRKKQESDARHLLQLYNSALRQLQFDKAADYIVKRAELDTLNYVWQLEAGNFLSNYTYDFDNAMYYYDRVKAVATQQRDTLNIIKANISKAATYVSYNQTKMAISHYEDVEEMFNKWSMAENHRMIQAEIYNGMATVYNDYFMHEEAAELLNEATNIALKEIGDNNLDVVGYYINLSTTYDKQGKAQLAIDYTNKAIDILANHFPEEQDMLAIAYNGLGQSYGKLGEYDLSEHWFNESLKLKRQIYGSTSKAIAATYHNMGALYKRQEQYDKALEYYWKASKTWTDVFRENNSYLVENLGGIASVYDAQGKTEEAVELIEKSLDIALINYGKDDENTTVIFPTLYMELDKLAKTKPTEENIKKLNDFLSDKAVMAAVDKGGPASERGLSGLYYLLEYCGWNINSNDCVFNTIVSQQTEKKDLLLMKDGQITRQTFEGRIGVHWIMKYVDPQEKNTIHESYNKYLKEQ